VLNQRLLSTSLSDRARSKPGVAYEGDT